MRQSTAKCHQSRQGSAGVWHSRSLAKSRLSDLGTFELTVSIREKPWPLTPARAPPPASILPSPEVPCSPCLAYAGGNAVALRASTSRWSAKLSLCMITGSLLVPRSKVDIPFRGIFFGAPKPVSFNGPLHYASWLATPPVEGS
jgi:hypothetical protein